MPVETNLLSGILKGDRTVLSRAITCVESSSPADQATSEKLLNNILPQTGQSIRIAITGTPGAGKSTLIDKLGVYLINKGYRIAVLAIDPSSAKSGGSILGDKTRMENLSRMDNAFIRPSPSLGMAGGVAGKTREVILLCEAAGFDIIIVETMGVGQGELAVHNMVDFFLLLQIAGGGDELQGMKKGIVELADAIVFNKADGDNIKNTEAALKQIKMALHYLSTSRANEVPVLKCSALENKGVEQIWERIKKHIDNQKADKEFDKKRARQNREWMMNLLKNQIIDLLFSDKEVEKKINTLEQSVLENKILPAHAAKEIITVFKERKNKR